MLHMRMLACVYTRLLAGSLAYLRRSLTASFLIAHLLIYIRLYIHFFPKVNFFDLSFIHDLLLLTLCHYLTQHALFMVLDPALTTWFLYNDVVVWMNVLLCRCVFQISTYAYLLYSVTFSQFHCASFFYPSLLPMCFILFFYIIDQWGIPPSTLQ